MPSIPEDEIIDKLVKHGVCTRIQRKDCEDCQRRIKEAKEAIRQYAAKERVNELEWCFQREGDAIAAEAISRRIKQLKEGV